ncbi:MAG: hypothetical protein ACI9LU_001072 [Polaribacter sp.]|jgi:hypothetical protein
MTVLSIEPAVDYVKSGLDLCRMYGQKRLGFTLVRQRYNAANCFAYADFVILAR